MCSVIIDPVMFTCHFSSHAHILYFNFTSIAPILSCYVHITYCNYPVMHNAHPSCQFSSQAHLQSVHFSDIALIIFARLSNPNISSYKFAISKVRQHHPLWVIKSTTLPLLGNLPHCDEKCSIQSRSLLQEACNHKEHFSGQRNAVCLPPAPHAHPKSSQRPPGGHPFSNDGSQRFEPDWDSDE